MSSKKWLAALFATALAIGLALVGLNWLVDPFGVFDHDLLSWPSYEMTINPRTAKFSYLKEHHDEYDSYIIGCSSTSSYPTEELNEYLDGDFYNMIMYGADMLDVQQLAEYLMEHYEVRNLVVNVYIDNAVAYDEQAHPLSYAMPQELSGESKLRYASRFLFCDPRYAVDKLRAMREDTYLTQSFDVFDAETGVYDKKVRDVEPIGALEEYLTAYPVFTDYPVTPMHTSEAAIEGTMESLRAIRDLCGEKDIRFLVVCAPVYWEYFDCFDPAELTEFYTRLAEVTPYWDFSMSSVSFEPRYFYDGTHFRNCVGRMALARVFGDETIWCPEDFGSYVTTENAAAHMQQMLSATPADAADYTAQVPILMYHHIPEKAQSETDVTPELFETQIAALAEAGYTAVSLADLRAYVECGAELPEKSVVITFDDGYLSNYDYAWPVLEQYGMCATIFAIGSTMGQTEHYKDTDWPITPHFSYEQAAEMTASGVISVQSHSYDMHQWAAYETGRARENLLRWPDEGEEEYLALLRADSSRSCAELAEATGEEIFAIACPGGAWDTLTLVGLRESGFDVVMTEPAYSTFNTLVRGLPQSLYGLRRLDMGGVSVEEMLAYLADQ